MGSPAVGDIDNDGALDVVVPAEDGRIYAFDRRGHTLPGWPQCNASDRNACPVVAHGSVVLADILGEGRPQVINGGEQWMRVFGADGQLRIELETKGGTAPLSASPTVAAVDGTAWIFQTAGFSPDPTPTPQLGGVWAWRSSQALGQAPWPTFKQNMARIGSPVAPPTGAVARTTMTTRTTTRAATRVTTPAPTTTAAAPTTIAEVTSTTRAGDVAAPPRRHAPSGAGRVLASALAVAALTASAGVTVRRVRKR
jgi:hypothetical protein